MKKNMQANYTMDTFNQNNWMILIMFVLTE